MNTDRLRKIAEREAREHLRDFWRVNLVECYGDTLTDAEIDEVLRMIREDVRIPAPPRIIRTRDELEALDPQTILDTPAEAPYRARDAVDAIGAGEWEGEWLPAVVIATGEQVRAARQALEGPRCR